MSKITWQDLFELGDDTPITEAIKKVNDFGNALENLIKKMEATGEALAGEYETLLKTSEDLLKKTNNMNLALEEEANVLEKVAIQVETLEKEDAVLKKSMEGNIAAMNKLKDAASEVEKAKKKLTENNTAEIGSINDLKRQLKEAEKAYLDMGEATSEAVKAESAENIKKLKTQITEASSALKTTKEQAKFAAGSYYELNQRVNEAKKRLKEMEGGLDGNSKEFKELQREVKEGSDRLKQFDEEVGDNQRKVGDYAGQIERLVPGFGMIARGAGIADKSLMKLAMNPVGLVIIAISTALAGLAAWFKTTGEGEDKLSQGLAYLGQIGNNLMKILAELGKYLVAVFLEPKKLLDDLINLFSPISTKLTEMWENPVQAVKDFGKTVFKSIGVAGEAISKIFKGDFKEGFKQLADAGIQATLGIENGTDKIVKGFENVADAAEKAWGVITKGADQQMLLDKQADDLEDKRINNIVRNAETELKTNKLILESKNKLDFTDQQRVDKLKEYNRLILEQSKINIDLAKEELRIKEAQIALATNDPTSAQLEEIAKLRANVIDLEAKYYSDIKKSTSELNALEMEIEKARQDRIAKRQKAETDLLSTRLSAEIKVNEEIIANEESTFERKAELLNENAAKREEMLESQKALELAAIDRAVIEKILTDGTEHEAEILESARIEKENIHRKYAENTRLIYKKLSDDLENNVFTELAKDLEKLTSSTITETNKQATALAEAYLNGKITAKEYSLQRLAIDENMQNKLLENQLESLKKKLNALEKEKLDTTEVLQQISEIEKQLAEDAAKFRLEKDAHTRAQLQQSAELLYEGLIMIGDQYTAAQEQRAIERREKIEADYARDIELAGDNIAQREAIEAAYVERRRKAEQDEIAAKRKRAQFEKAIAATQVIINTAQGIMRAVAEVPKGDFGISTAILIGVYTALGAVQLSQILGTPIPAFEKGTDYAPEGWALVGEKGAEIIEHKGKAYIAGRDGAELTYLERGSKVYTASETERMLNDGAIISTGKVFDNDVKFMNDVSATREMIEVIDSRFDSLEYTIRTKKEFHLNITREGVQMALKNGLDWTNFLNEHYG